MPTARFVYLAAIILALYIGVGLVYSAVTPIFENGDEEYHFQYALALAQGKGLPVIGDGQLGQIAAHPPIYYAIGSLVLRFTDTTDLASYYRYNPHAQLTRFDRSDNKNRFVHTTQESFPYHGTALAVQLLRWLSLAFGTVTVLFTGLIVRQLLPDRPYTQLVAMAAVGFLPQFLVVSTSVRNDTILIACSTIGLWYLAVALKRDLTWRETILLGIVCGLAALAKSSGPLLAGFVIGGIVIARWLQGRTTAAINSLFTILIPTVLIASWWYARNFLLYGDWLATQTMLTIVGDRNLSIGQVLVGAEPFLWSWWATAGWFNIALPPFIYWTLDFVALVLLIGAFQWARERWRSGERNQVIYLGLLALWSLIIYSGVVGWAQHAPLGYDGRLAFPALPAIAVLCAIGGSYWASSSFLKRASGVTFLVIWIALAVAFPLFVVRPAFARPPPLSESDLPAQMIPIVQDYGGEIKLLGLTLSPDTAKPGDFIRATLYWQAVTKPTKPYSVVISLLGRGGQVIAHADTYPGRGNYPTDLWEAGQVIVDEYTLAIAPDTVAPTQVRVFLGLYDDATNTNLEPSPAILAVPIKLQILPAQPDQINGQDSLAVFNEQIWLMGYDVAPTRLTPGSPTQIRLEWATREYLTEDLTVFTHLIDSQNQLAGQTDRQPADGDWPTSLWIPNMLWPDEYTLAVLPTAAVGPAQIEIGLYRLSDGARLTLESGDDTYRLPTPLTIEP